MEAFSDMDVCCRSSNVCICYRNFTERLKDCEDDLMMERLPQVPEYLKRL